MTADWREIEQAAREQVQAELVTRLDTPLVFGEHIAWAVNRFGRTDDLSPIHRVGFPVGNEPFTTCGEAIPNPVSWLVLSPRLIQSMPPCRFCESEYARAPQESAA